MFSTPGSQAGNDPTNLDSDREQENGKGNGQEVAEP